MTTTPQAALLSVHWYSIDKHGAATLCVDEDDAKATAIDSQTLYPHNGPYRAVQMAPIEPVQAGELPDEREAFKSWMRENTRYGIFSSYGELGWSVWQAATARAAIAESQAKQVTPSTFALQALVNMLDMAYQVQQNDDMAIVFEPETKARIIEAKAELSTLAARKPLTDMDRAVLRMPMDMAFGDELGRFQFYQRVQGLLDRIDGIGLEVKP